MQQSMPLCLASSRKQRLHICLQCAVSWQQAASVMFAGPIGRCCASSGLEKRDLWKMKSMFCRKLTSAFHSVNQMHMPFDRSARLRCSLSFRFRDSSPHRWWMENCTIATRRCVAVQCVALHLCNPQPTHRPNQKHRR